jgi:hypothetical protein
MDIVVDREIVGHCLPFPVEQGLLVGMGRQGNISWEMADWRGTRPPREGALSAATKPP